MRFHVGTDRKLIRAGARSRRFVGVEIEAPEAPPRPGRLPVNLAFVLDRSGSMAGGKIEKAREAVIHGIRALRPEDRFAVVAYDDKVEIVVPSTAATAEARAAAEQKVARIDDRGSTDLCAGWLCGCEEIRLHLGDEAVGRCLLLTDGLANAGVTDHDEIVRRVSTLRSRRVATSAFGLGADFDEFLLARIAEAGGGNFRFIEGAAQIPEFIAGEVGEALAITARDAVLVVEPGEGSTVESLNDFPCVRQGEAWRIELGSLFSGQSLDPVLEITFPTGERGAVREVRVRLDDRDGTLGRPEESLRFTWAGHAENDRQERDRSVDRRVAPLFAARAEREALRLNREGDYAGARRVVERCIKRIRAYAGGDREILAVAHDIQEKVETYADDMDPIARKFGLSLSTARLKGRRPRRMPPPSPNGNLVVLPAAGLDGLVEQAIAHLGGADAALGALLATAPAMTQAPGFQRGLILPADEEALVRKAVDTAPAAGLRIAFTRGRFPDNWFSHWDEPCRTALVSMADWDGTFAVPAVAFVAYEIVHHGLRLVAPAYDPERLMHAEARGCLFDLCETRADIETKLRAGHLCPACAQALEAAGVATPQALRLVEAIRFLATAALVVH
jgi:Ca-activated chloride channel family protein